MTEPKNCAVMAFDSQMFGQARECIQLLKRFSKKYAFALRVLSLGLKEDEIAWLTAQGIGVNFDYSMVPIAEGGPDYQRAMTCRPYLRELFPGFEVYLWVDADIRVVDEDALVFYLGAAHKGDHRLVISQEVDQTYSFVRDPALSQNYHRVKYRRMQDVYGQPIADQLTGFLCFNAGIFAMHRECPVWELYRENLQRALATSFDHMKEQDALNVAILLSGMHVHVAPAQMNWLCSISMPAFASSVKKWVRQVPPHLPISVLHLTNSATVTTFNGVPMSFYEIYRKCGLTR